MIKEDLDFANKYNLKVKPVILPPNESEDFKVKMSIHRKW